MILKVRFEKDVEAYRFLALLEQIIFDYGCITIADVYDMEIDENPLLAASLRTSYTDNKYGWINLKKAKVIYDEGWTLQLPKLYPIM